MEKLPKLNKRRKLICDRALSLLGTPYLHQGRDEHGCDCLGLVMYAYSAVVGDIVYPIDYKPIPQKYSLERELLRYFKGRSPFEPYGLLPADVITFSFDRRPHHLGLYLGESEFIHAINLRVDDEPGVQISQLGKRYWLRRAESVFRLEDLEF